jgi:hypothetical protein
LTKAVAKTWLVGPTDAPHLSKMGFANETAIAHIAAIRNVHAAAVSDPSPDTMSLANFCVRLLWRHKLERHWRWSTLQRTMAALAGACAALPLYVHGSEPVMLNKFPEWTAATRAARYRAVAEAPTQATPASSEQILMAVNTARLNNDTRTAEIIALAWATAARIGCTTQLKGEDLSLDSTDPHRALVTFKRGKGVQMRRQAYTVAINLGQLSYVLQPLFARKMLAPTSFL